MRRKRNPQKEIEAVREKVRREAAPTIAQLDRIKEEHRRLDAQMVREWKLIRGEL